MLARLLSLFAKSNDLSDDKCDAIFYNKVAVFAHSLENLWYRRLWTQNGGKVRNVPGFLTAAHNTRLIDGVVNAELQKIWVEVFRHADYVFVDGQTWANQVAVDLRFDIIPFDPDWILDCIQAGKIVSSVDHAFWPSRISPSYVSPKPQLQLYRSPLCTPSKLVTVQVKAIQHSKQHLSKNNSTVSTPSTPRKTVVSNSKAKLSTSTIKRNAKHAISQTKSARVSRRTPNYMPNSSLQYSKDDSLDSVIRPTNLRKRFFIVKEEKGGIS
ncbi:hypothetical protein V1512DRAFT_273392 [Lipomyces arxii]|uniref:uncharacterized protein n=1 Tax=Lipomyces arxii TaxID=56418 RepID=UPI0034CD3781